MVGACLKGPVHYRVGYTMNVYGTSDFLALR